MVAIVGRKRSAKSSHRPSSPPRFLLAVLVLVLAGGVRRSPPVAGGQLLGAPNAAQPEFMLAPIGSNLTLNCRVPATSGLVWWTRDGLNITGEDEEDRRFVAHKFFPEQTTAELEAESANANANVDDDDDDNDFRNSDADAQPSQPSIEQRLTVIDVRLTDSGNYSCQTEDSADSALASYTVQSVRPAQILAHSARVVRTRVSQSVQFYCLFDAYPLDAYNTTIRWHKRQPAAVNNNNGGDTNWSAIAAMLHNNTQFLAINETAVNVTLDIPDVNKKDNGTYYCSIQSPWPTALSSAPLNPEPLISPSALLVLDVPIVSIDHVKAVGAATIFLNWTINDGNDPVQHYHVKYRKQNTTTFTYFNHMIDGRNTSYVLDGFEPDTEYEIQIRAKNSIGDGPIDTWVPKVRTLAADPVFIPQIGVKGNTHSTITIGWQPPPAALLDFINYYELVVRYNSSVIEATIYQQNSRNLPYMFDNLRCATEYRFRVRACNDLTRLCGNWSEEVSGTTMDGTASAPLNLRVKCAFYNISGRTTVTATWDRPAQPNGNISLYHIVLDGIATFRQFHTVRNETWGPKAKTIAANLYKADYENVPPNTNYTVRVSGMTRSKRPGEVASASCSMQPTVPDDINKAQWGKIQTETGQWVLKMFMPPVSERNGPICGYRIYMVRMGRAGGGHGGSIGGGGSRHLGAPDSLPVMSYHEAHAANNTRGGAYIAEILSRDSYRDDVFLGDGQRVRNNETALAAEPNASCRKLLNGYYERKVVASPTTTTTTSTTTTQSPAAVDGGEEEEDEAAGGATGSGAMDTVPVPLPPVSTQKEQLDRAGNLTPEANKILNTKNRRRRQMEARRKRDSLNSIPVVDTMAAATTESAEMIAIKAGTSMQLEYEVFDGLLDPNSNYTAFIEVIVNIDRDQTTASQLSDLLDTRTGGAPFVYDMQPDSLTEMLNIATQVLCGLILLVLVLLLALYVWHRYSKTAVQGDEIISLRDSLSRAFCGGRSGHNHRYLIGSSSVKPGNYDVQIARCDLPMAYVQKHKDTDYGFRCEFEVLPPRFNDRTTKHSDAKENQFKNRYPDIKAYDQTRVRLAERNATIGSDYINANFVLGYKERKKFICAQGPMDSTISDFWRMIWEQHLEIIVMLTNLEEYNKTKCAKYWPEKVGDATKFGDITVTFSDEQRFSDYLVRHLKITRRSTSNGNAGGGVAAAAAQGNNVGSENNVAEAGAVAVVANDGAGSGAAAAAAASSAAAADSEDCRHITQYHYLVWKDFSAPEHPHGILKFIRQINSVYSLQRGPILVHCSAGVGRTGTLVALDSLMQQLEEEGHVSIFNVVCDMRHQRNFLVQSLKQYIFLYRALLDLAQFGNTEIQAKDLNSTVENLKIKPNDSKEQCKLEIEFERIKTIKDDINKSFAVGLADENRDKNRSDTVIPFDGNRVILTPIPSREHSTYINASFIEGYDNSESFIITQDPLDNTIADFWRMISEQGINTIVMISEIGDGPKKCPRYWADEEIQYDHILVQYMHSESCPYYTRREFNVTNCKQKDTIKVTQFQYNGWPTVEGEVPEVARGMIELVDQAQNHHNGQDSYASIGPIVVHCNLGTERSSIYVAMCILVQHLRTEKKIDICTVARKLRSQRNTLLDSYAQYEFLHRALVNYADLHRTSLELPTSGD